MSDPNRLQHLLRPGAAVTAALASIALLVPGSRNIDRDTNAMHQPPVPTAVETASPMPNAIPREVPGSAGPTIVRVVEAPSPTVIVRPAAAKAEGTTPHKDSGKEDRAKDTGDSGKDVKPGEDDGAVDPEPTQTPTPSNPLDGYEDKKWPAEADPTETASPLPTGPKYPEQTPIPESPELVAAVEAFTNEFFSTDPNTPHPAAEGVVNFMTGKGSYSVVEPVAKYLPDLQVVLFAWYNKEVGTKAAERDKLIVHPVPVGDLGDIRVFGNTSGDNGQNTPPIMVDISGPIVTKVGETGEELFAGSDGGTFGRFTFEEPIGAAGWFRIFDDKLEIVNPPRTTGALATPTTVSPPLKPTPAAGG